MVSDEKLLDLQNKAKKRNSRYRPDYLEIEKERKINEWRKFLNEDWPAFQKTKEYAGLHYELTKAGIRMPYSENIIYRIYYAGYFKKPFIN